MSRFSTHSTESWTLTNLKHAPPPCSAAIGSWFPYAAGADDGFDGAVADATSEPFPLITTTGAKLVPNLSRSLDHAERKGWRPSRALFATSRRITPKTRKKLFEAARARGVTLLQAYDQDWFAQRLYREPEWCGPPSGSDRQAGRAQPVSRHTAAAAW